MFTNQDEKYLLAAIKKIKRPQNGLPFPVFEALCKIVPFVGCEIIIKDRKGRFLLTWRDDKWYHGWHFPGGLLRAGDTFKRRINETAIRELGVRIKKISFLKPMDSGRRDNRGYGISLAFLCVPDKEPAAGRFFSKMPKDIIPEHRALWKELRSGNNK